MVHVLGWVGERFRRGYVGQLTELGLRAIISGFRRSGNRKHHFDQVVTQLYFTGVEALPLVLFLVLGSATILQSATVMPKFGAGDYFGNVMVVVVVREVGPLFTAFLIAGRTGSALSTYLGNMKVQSEIDALRSLGVDPIRYLVFPAFAATVTSMFCLTVLFNLSAIFGGFFVVKGLQIFAQDATGLELPLTMYLDRILASMSVLDGVIGLVKPMVFGALVSVIACHHGITVGNDIREVPKATTRGVVNSFVAIVLADSLFALPFIANMDLL
jgi:phospholipid/cholesterol/gamma-HCH transport system permease protein